MSISPSTNCKLCHKSDLHAYPLGFEGNVLLWHSDRKHEPKFSGKNHVVCLYGPLQYRSWARESPPNFNEWKKLNFYYLKTKHKTHIQYFTKFFRIRFLTHVPMEKNSQERWKTQGCVIIIIKRSICICRVLQTNSADGIYCCRRVYG